MKQIKRDSLMKSAITLLAIALPLTAHAEWTGGVEGGTVLDGDNPGTNVELILKNMERPLTHEINAEWLRNGDGFSTYELSYEPKYWFSDMTYAFGEGSITTFDSPSLDQYQRLFGGGLGIELINNEAQKLQAEVGAFHSTSVVSETDFEESEVSLGLAAYGSQIISDLIKLEVDADYLTSENVDVASAEAGISLRIPNGAIKYSFNYISSTIGDNDAVDNSSSSVSVRYNF